MAMQNGAESDGVLRERAKEILTNEEYERLKIVVKNFSKTRSVEELCSNLFKIVNSTSKVDILAGVRRCLPKNQRNKFTRYCNELLKTEALRERRDLEKKRKMESNARGRDLENRVPNFLGSPAKKTKQDGEKPLSSKTGKKATKGIKKSVPDCPKEVLTSETRFRKHDACRKLASNSSVDKIVVLERDSLNQGFGFRIRGGSVREPSISIAEVAKGSLADRQGLKRGEQVVQVNDKLCGKRGVNMVHLICIIKAAKVLHMQIASTGLVCGNDCKVAEVAEAKEKEKSKAEEKRMSTVAVYPGSNGWLGCCIRGGSDYACDVHVISVDMGSPAEKAGVKAGDEIVAINGTSTKDLTHVQVVRLVITSGPCVTFSLKCGSKQRRSSRQQPTDVRPTPLRSQHGGTGDATPPQSASFRQFHLPGYSHKHHGKQADSPSQLPLDVLKLDCLPPPPYTPEVPSRHRVLARGEGQGTPYHPPQDTTYIIELQDTQRSQESQGTNFGQETKKMASEQEPQGSHFCQEQQVTTIRDEPQGVSCQQESQSTHNQDVAIERHEIDAGQSLNSITDDDRSLDRNMADVFQDGDIMEPNNASFSRTMQLTNVPSLEEKAPVNCNDGSLPLSTSQSPAQDNGRESFLGQIRQFNKAELKRLSDCPQSNTSDKVHNTTSKSSCTPEEVHPTADDGKVLLSASQSPQHVNGRESFLSQIRQFNKATLRKLPDSENNSAAVPFQRKPSKSSWIPEEALSTDMEDERDGVQESIDAGSLFTALTQVLQNRARVLQDTLTSADEYDSDSCSDDEWDL